SRVAPPRTEAATEDPTTDEPRESVGQSLTAAGQRSVPGAPVTSTNASATGMRTRADASMHGANESTTARIGAPAEQGNVGPRSDAGRARHSDSVRGNNARMDGSTDADLTVSAPVGAPASAPVGAPQFSDEPGSPRNESASAVATYATNVGTNIGPLRR